MPDKKPDGSVIETRIERPEPVKLSADEVRKRMQEFATQRKGKLIAADRKGRS